VADAYVAAIALLLWAPCLAATATPAPFKLNTPENMAGRAAVLLAAGLLPTPSIDILT